jgi:hypothetical protein
VANVEVGILRATLLQPLVIQRKPFDDELAQPFCGPDAKLGAAMRLHPIAD